VDHADAGERLLAQAVQPFAARYPDVEVVLEAVPVHASRMLADASVHAGVVVVGSRGRGAFAELLLGSVSQSVLTHAHCPVVVAR
jgi:nucleotide-binding universal stress UspA family protein